MKKNIFKIVITAGIFVGSFASCTKKLDLLPTNDITAAQVYSTPAGYKEAFAKVYGSFALTGNNGPGSGDIQGIDPGTSDFLRLYWNAQELSTDEAIDNYGWGDIGLHDFHNMNWSSSNPMMTGLYFRSYYQITLCNDFIRQASDANLAARGITGADAAAIKVYATEARFLRAFQYSIILDVFGSGPMVTENDVLGAALPKQAARADIFTYVESELKAIDAGLVAAKANEYGRADKAAAWSLLARLYLNAQVYTGTPRWNDAVTYSKKVIDAGYTLETNYNWLLLNDNYKCTNEFILTINYDGLKTQNYGATNYIVWAGSNSDIGVSATGVGGWGGNRTTKNLPNLFSAGDLRYNFFSTGHNIDINDRATWTDGYAVTKYKNINRDGSLGVQLKDLGVGIDFPLFRLAEQYLIYAEATSRGGAGDAALALTYINNLRTRAYGNASGNITSNQLTVDFILDERARELYWEGFRRTDLVRYNKFVEGTYLWPWKGGVQGGTGSDAFRKIYPIPSADISSNVNLTQNPGY